MSMNFMGRGTPMTRPDFADAVATLNCDDASLWAVFTVETRGFGFFRDRRPQILFERHIFHKRTGGKFSAANPDISNPKAGGYHGGAAEYDRLAKAMTLNQRAALESASWGLGQVMGFNAVSSGFSDVEAMVTAMVAGEVAQLKSVVGYIRSRPPLLNALRAHTWDRVAFFYNGSSFAKNHYDAKLRQNFLLFQTEANRPNVDVRTAQACLTYLKFDPRGIDGHRGPGFEAALAAYRQVRGIPAATPEPEVFNRLATEAGI
jgi:hypothetical protein